MEYTIWKRGRQLNTIKLMDVTLRDGSYAVDFEFDPEFVTCLLQRLESSRIDFIEVGHGMGVEAERAGSKACNLDHEQWALLARENLNQSRWGFFAQPRFSTIRTLLNLADAGMSFVRVGMRADQVQDHLAYLYEAVDKCEHVYLNLMKTSATPINAIPRYLEGIPEELAGIYVVDSFGSMIPETVRDYVQTIIEMNPSVGFHGHDNLGMANANSIAAAEAGARLVDGTLNGIGRGSGNAQIESLATLFKLQNLGDYEFQNLAHSAEFCRKNLDPLQESRSLEVLGGAFGVHSERFSEVTALADEFGLEIAEVMWLEAALSRTQSGEKSLRGLVSISSKTLAAEKL